MQLDFLMKKRKRLHRKNWKYEKSDVLRSECLVKRKTIPNDISG